MRKIKKLFTIAAVAVAAGTFFTLNSSNEIICGNIEALTGGDTGSSGPEMRLVTMGRKANTKEQKDAWNGLETNLPQGFSELSTGKHIIEQVEYTDCGTYTFGFVIYDGDYGKCVGWYEKNTGGGIGPMGNWKKCPQNH